VHDRRQNPLGRLVRRRLGVPCAESRPLLRPSAVAYSQPPLIGGRRGTASRGVFATSEAWHTTRYRPWLSGCHRFLNAEKQTALRKGTKGLLVPAPPLTKNAPAAPCYIIRSTTAASTMANAAERPCERVSGSSWHPYFSF
jgi:hypothetical protein